MPVKNLEYYCLKFLKLRRDYKNGGAPHKPVLLISLIQAYQSKLFTTRKVSILPEFVGLYKSNWKTLVKTNHQCLFTLPFYHMSSEPFWNLVPNIGCEIWVKSKGSMRSFSNLMTAVKYAEIDGELKNIFLNKEESDILIQYLLDTYFPETKVDFKANFDNNYLSEIENEIVSDSSEIYQERLAQLRRELDNDGFQEEVFIRSNIFKKEVPKIYNYTCCISEMRIDALDNISMIDACHIIPFSESYNDTISNGIALCPNLHRAFDRGLISIDGNYRVIMKTNFSEPFPSTYNIRQFEGKKILLPDHVRCYPSMESLTYHLRKFGF
ncbi:HNH endonuclease [Gaoshiqia sediminis]|uniref:HNH endonuclease n=1 Tax=Gaoshiqia sediminis TaxID=2986998 RepID=A0AA41YDZ7_9BACT|nr:HNH endonuclease [Gaoshiqia sediminis]MCW0483837.1 HNH endonuclease [Gaoshiqia sediminis]